MGAHLVWQWSHMVFYAKRLQKHQDSETRNKELIYLASQIEIIPFLLGSMLWLVWFFFKPNGISLPMRALNSSFSDHCSCPWLQQADQIIPLFY